MTGGERAGAPLRALLVDDEPPARRRLRRLLERAGGVTIVGEAGRLDEAARALDALRPDVVFLDIRMPGGTGFDALGRARHRPEAVVFVTAYGEYALDAFEADGIDYLVKPVTEERLARCLDKVRAVVGRRGEAGPPPSLEELVARAVRAATTSPRLAARTGDRVVFVDAADVVCFLARDKYTVATTQEGREYVLDESLRELEGRLPEGRFLRIHRGALVNADAVVEVRAAEGGRYRVRLADRAGTVLRTSRAGARVVRAVLLGASD